MKKRVIGLFSVLLSSFAGAEGFYGVGELTHSTNSLDRDYFDNTLIAAGANGIQSKDDHSGTRWRLQGGYAFNQYFSIEGGYIDFGVADYKAQINSGSAKGSLKAGGIDAVGLAWIPISDALSVFAKAGVVAVKAKSQISADTLVPPLDDHSTKSMLRPLLGVGASYAIYDHWNLRADYDQVSNIGKSTSTGTMTSRMFSVGVQYNF